MNPLRSGVLRRSNDTPPKHPAIAFTDHCPSRPLHLQATDQGYDTAKCFDCLPSFACMHIHKSVQQGFVVRTVTDSHTHARAHTRYTRQTGIRRKHPEGAGGNVRVSGSSAQPDSRCVVKDQDKRQAAAQTGGQSSLCSRGKPAQLGALAISCTAGHQPKKNTRPHAHTHARPHTHARTHAHTGPDSHTPLPQCASFFPRQSDTTPATASAAPAHSVRPPKGEASRCGCSRGTGRRGAEAGGRRTRAVCTAVPRVRPSLCQGRRGCGMRGALGPATAGRPHFVGFAALLVPVGVCTEPRE